MARGDLLLVSLPVSGGREQSGTRPALAIQSDNIGEPMLIVAPITSNLNALRFSFTVQIDPTSENGLMQSSVVMIFQIRAIDKNRILKKFGKLSSSDMQKMDAEIRKILGI